jgi:hypothetical protein
LTYDGVPRRTHPFELAAPDLVSSTHRPIIPSLLIATFLLKQAGLKRGQAHTGAVTLIQRFGSAANLNIHLHCMVLDGVYRSSEGVPVFHEVRGPTAAELEALLEPDHQAHPEVTNSHRLPH